MHTPSLARCNCSMSWDATGGNNLTPGCTTRKALLAAADAGAVARCRNAPYSYYQVVFAMHGVVCCWLGVMADSFLSCLGDAA